MMRNLCLSLFFTFVLVSNVFSQNIFDLKGKSIIVPPTKEQFNNCVYTEHVLKKYKFKSEYLYTESILGDVIEVLDVRHINKGGNKEAVLLLINHNGNNVVLYLPMHGVLYYPPKGYEESNDLYLSFYTDASKKDKFFSITFSTRPEDVVLYNYDAILLDSINRKYRDKYIYLKTYPNSEMACEGEPKTQVKYKFNEIKFSEDFEFLSINNIYPNRYKFKLLKLFLESPHGDISIPIKMDPIYDAKVKYDYWGSGIYLGDFEDLFETEEDFIEHSKSKYDLKIIKYLKDKYINKEIYSYDHLKYFLCKDIDLCWSETDNIYFEYFAYLEDPTKNTSFRVPINADFERRIVLAEVQRKKEAEEARKRAEEEAEYQAMLEKEEREYKAGLIRKYGRANALLILENAVKIGFTKEMCVEAWGTPYDINRTVTRNCIHEQWVYGIGRYLYFEGNILTAIQD